MQKRNIQGALIRSQCHKTPRRSVCSPPAIPLCAILPSHQLRRLSESSLHQRPAPPCQRQTPFRVLWRGAENSPLAASHLRSRIFFISARENWLHLICTLAPGGVANRACAPPCRRKQPARARPLCARLPTPRRCLPRRQEVHRFGHPLGLCQHQEQRVPQRRTLLNRACSVKMRGGRLLACCNMGSRKGTASQRA